MEQVNHNKGKLVARPGIEPKTPVFNPGLYPQFLRIKQLQYQKVSFWEWLKQD